jgi:hypothetical protein
VSRYGSFTPSTTAQVNPSRKRTRPKRSTNSFVDEESHQVDLLVLDELGFVPFDRAGGASSEGP